MADAIDEICPTCKVLNGYPCRDMVTGRPFGSAHSSRQRKANGRARRMKKKLKIRRVDRTTK